MSSAQPRRIVAPFDPPLLLVTDRRRFGRAGDAAERRVIAAALGGGVGAVQLREKDLDGGELLRRALALRELTDPAGVPLLVNDRVDVAAAARAGVHLPESGLRPAEARRVLQCALPSTAASARGACSLVGRSIHSIEEIERSDGADYLLFGPIFDTPSKRSFGPPQGLAALAAVTAASMLPVLAVGGVTPARVGEVLDAGAAGVAVIGALLDAADPAQAAREFALALRDRGRDSDSGG